jgi:hypothetical protein
MATVKYMHSNILADANDPTLYVHIVVSFFCPSQCVWVLPRHILVLPIHTLGPLMHILGL